MLDLFVMAKYTYLLSLAIPIMQSTEIWNLSNETITLHVVSFQFVFTDINNEVITMQFRKAHRLPLI